MSDIEAFLFRLFSDRSMQSPGYKSGQLKLNTFYEMIEKSGIPDESLPLRSIEQITLGITKRSSSLTFDKFCSVITKLAAEKFASEHRTSPKTAFLNLIDQFLMPLFESDNSSAIEVPADCASIFHSMYDRLKTMYVQTFPIELRGEPIEDISRASLQSLEKFLRHIDVFPVLLNKASIYNMWRDIVIKQESQSLVLLQNPVFELGKVLTLSKFAMVIYQVSQISNTEEVSPSEKLSAFFERISLTMPDFAMAPKPRTQKPTQSRSDSPNNEKTTVRLQKVFQMYSAFGDALNTKTMKSNNFKRLLRDCGVLKERNQCLVTPVDANLIFARLTSKRENPRVQVGLDFEYFCKALELVAEKVYPDKAEPFQQFLTSYVWKIVENIDDSKALYSQDIKSMVMTLQDSNISELLSLVHKSISYYYNYYANGEGQMNLDRFLKFSRDFELFPDIVPKTRLTQLFYALTSIDKPVPTFKYDMKKNFIDVDIFVKALALISKDLECEKNVTPADRLSLLIERLNQSQGPLKVIREKGHGRRDELQNLMHMLRNKDGKRNKPTFAELASQLSLNQY